MIPLLTQSVAEMRTDNGLWSGQICRTASSTSSGNRNRRFRVPPYWSRRRLESGDMNDDSR